MNLNLTPSIPIKRRSPWGVWVLSIVTLGIYYLIWYYNINREMAEANPTRRVSPLGALMAITFGAFLVVPALVSFYNTGVRIRQAQQDAGLEPSTGAGLGVLLSFLLWFNLPYHQSGLNRVVDAHTGAVPE